MTGPYRPDAQFTCPVCEQTSYNPADAKHGYCGNCNEFTGTDMGRIAAVLRRVFERTSISIHSVTATQTIIRNTGITIDQWQKRITSRQPKPEK